jgi:uncharacterized protein YabE (DUF348 family)
MTLLSNNKKYLLILTAIGFTFFAYRVFAFWNQNSETLDFENQEKSINLNDNGLNYKINTNSDTVDSLLKEKNITLGDHDTITPDKNSKIYQNVNIEIDRAVPIKIQVDGKKIQGFALSRNVRGALLENGITLGRLDKTDPSPDSPAVSNLTIIVTRINVEEITQDEDIDFKTIIQTDPKLGWREKNITTPGVKGTREVKYRITYKNNQEISRVALSKTVVKDPVTQVETDGTFVKVGAANKGQATWYSYQGGMFAASLAIPRGGYAKVTNTASGKSIIVQINDSGPYGKGRIIDLDKVAFQKIADIGAGVIGVKVEEVLN